MQTTSKKPTPVDVRAAHWGAAQHDVLEAAELVAIQPVPTFEALKALRDALKAEKLERRAFSTARRRAQRGTKR